MSRWLRRAHDMAHDMAHNMAHGKARRRRPTIMCASFSSTLRPSIRMRSPRCLERFKCAANARGALPRVRSPTSTEFTTWSVCATTRAVTKSNACECTVVQERTSTALADKIRSAGAKFVFDTRLRKVDEPRVEEVASYVFVARTRIEPIEQA